MENILNALNEFRQSNEFPLWLPYLRLVVMLVVGCVLCLASAVQIQDVLAAVRQTLRDIGVTDKDACGLLGVNRGNLCDKLRGERPWTLESLSKFPVEFWQAFPVRLAMCYGSPSHVVVGARLARDARRQARMSLSQPSTQKAGIA